MVRIRIEDSAQYESLMDSESYDAFVASEGLILRHVILESTKALGKTVGCQNQ